MFVITALFSGIFLEVLLYGVYFATFIRHVRILVLRREKMPLRAFLFLSTASILLFLVVTVTMMADLIFATSIFKNPTEPVDFSGFCKMYNIKVVCGSFATAVSDTVLLYRLYIPYNSRLRVVALPLLVFVVQCGVPVFYHVLLSSIKDNWKGLECGTLFPSLSKIWGDHPLKLTLGLSIFGCLSAGVNKSQKLSLLPVCGAPTIDCWPQEYLQSPSAYVRVGAVMINSAAINVVWWFSVFVTSTISSLLYDVCAVVFGCVTALIFSTVIVSASRPPSSESEFRITRISFAPRAFPQDSMPGSTDLAANDNMLEAGVQLEESSSMDRSNINGASPKGTV
ncbi:hypothetical protein BDP27DRAFT_1416777 [Rhodocollybia butyracea]|uniref:Uncharacterized protein n=1 Tax=Rhodocollybia butyracea TaxID=206335 RepID=A0A9P5Q430_9AGAR|nr:hypothetical protein BDP27DRAFT_1416777 [Rhodocollybia butyracea]